MMHAHVWKPLLIFIASICLHLLFTVKFLLQRVRNFVRSLIPGAVGTNRGIAQGQTVLVTTGRQAKTLHIVRALKSVGATVVVTDYQKFSSSGVSLACDKFFLLPPLQSSQVHQWVEHFHQVLVDNKVDLVLPVSTINEVLYIALAKHKLQETVPHVQWFCPDLETCIQLDDRNRFSKVCARYGVPVPESDILVSSDDITALTERFSDGIIVKRIESSVNRAEEIVPIGPGGQCPAFVNPSTKNPWQWQRYVNGSEYSVWYVCVSGLVTFSACYQSAPDLVHFDPAPVPEDIDEPIRRMIRKLGLTGQYSFDFIRERTGKSYVTECNPRASSILETVSHTPGWAEAFFGVDVSYRAVHNRVGFLYHKTCWPFASRSDGYFSLKDPLPILCAEIAWPLNAIANVSEDSYRKIDVNICKIITKGQSLDRGLNFFSAELEKHYLNLAMASLRHMDTIIIDVSIAGVVDFIDLCKSFGLKVLPFYHASDAGIAKDIASVSVICLPNEKITDEFLATHKHGETRLLLGARFARVHGSLKSISYRVVDGKRTWGEANEIPLRKLRAVHVMGSCTSEYYEDLSSYYGYDCINSMGKGGRFEHIVAYVHLSGLWSIENGQTVEFMKSKAERMTTGKALCKLESLKPDVIVPHMFDYKGLTAYRGLFDIMQIPLIGCTSEALALSTNKVRTKACAAMAGVRTPKHEIVRKGGKPSILVPFVVKPVEEDNSQGIELVRKDEEIEAALDGAFKFGDQVMCEEFVDLGRELRVGLIESGDGGLEMLPVIEYFLSEESPIRRPEDKIITNKDGKVMGLSFSERRCPAEIDETLRSKLFTSATIAHTALGCRDYSIYDFRVDDEGEVFLLETCLYCSFAPTSVLVTMQSSVGAPKTQLFERLFERAMTRRDDDDRNTQSVGMKKRF